MLATDNHRRDENRERPYLIDEQTNLLPSTKWCQHPSNPIPPVFPQAAKADTRNPLKQWQTATHTYFKGC